MRRIVLSLAIVAIFLPLSTTSAQLDCGSFATQEQAQAVLDVTAASALDSNGNGVACEADEAAAPAVSVVTTNQESANLTCADFDAWEWSQSLLESDPTLYASLDSDGDGEACPELPRGGFAPAFWTDSIPDDVQEVEIIRIIDGDTFEVLLDGVSNRVRIYRADTPETQREQHCGGPEATAFAEYVLSLNDTPGIVYLERDVNERDQFGRELAYLWFEIDGLPYMLNHALINNGWAEDLDYGDRLYEEQFEDAATFAESNDLGVYELCGAFEVPLNADQSAPVASGPAAPVAQEPIVEEVPAQGVGCDPNYTPCVPAYPPDLNCPDIGIAVTVIGGDPHGFDGNGDGYGCESYG